MEGPLVDQVTSMTVAGAKTEDPLAVRNGEPVANGSMSSHAAVAESSAERASSPKPSDGSQPVVDADAAAADKPSDASAACTAAAGDSHTAAGHGPPSTLPEGGSQTSNGGNAATGKPTGSSPVAIAAAAAQDRPPDDPLDAQTLDLLVQQATPPVAESRFSLSDIKRDPQVQQAARRELEGSFIGRPNTEPGSVFDSLGHDAEIERQRAVLRELDRVVSEEETVNGELLQLVLDRLEGGKHALDGMVQLLTTLNQVEQQRSSSLAAAAKLPLCGSADGAALLFVSSSLQQLPVLLAAAHQQLHQRNQQLLELIRPLQTRYAAAHKDVKNRGQEVRQAVEAGRRQIAATFHQHRTACKAFDDLVQAGAGRGLLLARLEADPWDTEGRLVSEQRALMAKQDEERKFLAEALSLATQLESDRVTQVTALTRQLLEAYADVMSQLPGSLAALVPNDQQAAAVVAQTPAQVADLQRIAADTLTATAELAARQATSVEDVVQELFASPEIARQGEMERWDPRTSTWHKRHFVLTRSGYLHCYERMSDDARCDMLRLSRCEMEQGEVQVINLMETGITSWLTRGSRKLVLKTSSVEEYCEWALALREAIALSSGKRGSTHGR